MAPVDAAQLVLKLQAGWDTGTMGATRASPPYHPQANDIPNLLLSPRAQPPKEQSQVGFYGELTRKREGQNVCARQVSVSPIQPSPARRATLTTQLA